jgi:hypothetical protein
VSVSAEITNPRIEYSQSDEIVIKFEFRTSIIKHQVGHLQIKAHFVILRDISHKEGEQDHSNR